MQTTDSVDNGRHFTRKRKPFSTLLEFLSSFVMIRQSTSLAKHTNSMPLLASAQYAMNISFISRNCYGSMWRCSTHAHKSNCDSSAVMILMIIINIPGMSEITAFSAAFASFAIARRRRGGGRSCKPQHRKGMKTR